ncbi:unnamed protein product [Adineta steineri]|uniref:G-protein coupled receptors family 1 profile domain-containing protein n=2 Tax=Adineta steineri TaxID=433720 RepID=A0A818K1V5_9BILA|nr:unnamed protein product [Adineta steineri]
MFNNTILLELNYTNDTCHKRFLWSPSTMESQRRALYICIVASIIHSIFWLQVTFCSSVRQKSMQWLYAYLITDILLLIRFFFLFIVHTTSTKCVLNKSWYIFICYFEALLDNYLNTIEVYILLALNICRYIQIVHNQNVYTNYIRILICTHLTIYIIPIFSYIIQLCVNWTQVREYVGSSCDTQFTNIYAQVINIIFGFSLPILLNVFVVCCNMNHIHSTSQLSQTQHHDTAREKYQRALVIQFLAFYIIWLLLWSPNIIVYQFTSGASNITEIASLLNYIEIALDPFIIAALDVRFQKSWRKLGRYFINRIFGKGPNGRKIMPTSTNPIRSTGHGQFPSAVNISRSLGYPQNQTTTFPTQKNEKLELPIPVT